MARRDKKNRLGRIAYALPIRIGAMASERGEYAVEADDALVTEVLQDMRRLRPKPRTLMAAEI